METNINHNKVCIQKIIILKNYGISIHENKKAWELK